MPRGLLDFEGTWRVTRTIDDRLGPPGRFEGTTCLTPDAHGLHYIETGQLTLGDGPSFQADRSYLWRADGRLIHILFSDDRPFHRFDPNAGGAGERHLCAPDIYDVIYEFSQWPHWTTIWTVTGPRKDYVMTTEFSVLPAV
ncbi:MAG: DUF6314 family protein [Pseudomonadota bacterium]